MRSLCPDGLLRPLWPRHSRRSDLSSLWTAETRAPFAYCGRCDRRKISRCHSSIRDEQVVAERFCNNHADDRAIIGLVFHCGQQVDAAFTSVLLGDEMPSGAGFQLFRDQAGLGVCTATRSKRYHQFDRAGWGSIGHRCSDCRCSKSKSGNRRCHKSFHFFLPN